MRVYKRIHQIVKLCLPGSTITFLNFVDVEDFKKLMLAMGMKPIVKDPSPEFAAAGVPADVQCFQLPEQPVNSSIGLVEVSRIEFHLST